MKCCCVEIKFAAKDWPKTVKRIEGHSYLYERYEDSYNITGEHDCTICKHKLACLMDPKCNRRFESK